MTRFLAVLMLVLPSSVAVAGALQDSDSATTLYETSGLAVIHRTTPGRDIVAVRLYLLGGVRQLNAATAGIEALLLRAAALDARGVMAPTGARTVS